MNVNPSDPATSPRFGPGARVEVRNHFDGSWAGGFEIEDQDPSGFWVRRISDQAVLPSQFNLGDIRSAGAA